MMKRILTIGILTSLLLTLAGVTSSVHANMGTYCQAPPYVNAVVPPNLMLAIDASGSMAYLAYDYTNSGVTATTEYCSNNSFMLCSSNSDCSHSYCAAQPSVQCTTSADCLSGSCVSPSPATGTCSAPSSTWVPPYGYCSNHLTSSCQFDYMATCPTGYTCCTNSGDTCIPRQVYEGYFDPSKRYAAGYCFLNATTPCDSDSDCTATGDTCNFFAGGTYLEDTTSASCNATYTYTCSSTNASGCISKTKPSNAYNTCQSNYYYCGQGTTLYNYTCSSSNTGGCTTTKPTNQYNNPLISCSGSSKYYCPGPPITGTISGNCGMLSGNLLNYLNMARIDLVSWALTGGSPSTCTSDAPLKCDPRTYKDTGSTVSCSDTLQVTTSGATDHGCTLQSQNGTKVNVRWTGRMDQGLLYQFLTLPVQPRIGLMTFSGNGVRNGSTNSGSTYYGNPVWIGDYNSSGTHSATYPYQNVLTELNSVVPNNGTPTGPAFWDVMNYYKQTSPQYGGLAIQTSTATEWRNPLYSCDANGANCSLVSCTKNFVMMTSDGEWNVNGSGTSTCSIGTITNINTSPDPVVPSYQMHMGFTNSLAGPAGTQTSVTDVYSIGLFISSVGQNALENVALYGSFDKGGGRTWPSNRTTYPGLQTGDPTNCTMPSDANCPSNRSTGSLCNSMPPSSTDWDKDGNGVPDTYYYAADASNIKDNMLTAVVSMISNATSGTAASVLASGQGSGANLLQALFYPNRDFDSNSSVTWTGTLQNLWYYLNPATSSSSIRENTPNTGPPYLLDLKKDEIVSFYFDPIAQQTMANLFVDVNGDGSVLVADTNGRATINANNVRNLWEAGLQLWNTTAANRTIYVNIDGHSATIPQFNTTTLGTTPALETLLNTDSASRTAANNLTVAQNIVNYIRGVDFPDPVTLGAEVISYRSRTTGTVNSSTADPAQVYKLGDIINSTPRISSWVPLNSYDLLYQDTSYGTFLTSNVYKNRGLVYAGANDGMLHAFKLGTLSFGTTGACSVTTTTICTTNTDCPATETCKISGLTSLAGTNLGSESWAFIPNNAVPYLQYLADPDYCHLYYVDLTPYVFDASINMTTDCSSAGITNYWQCTKQTICADPTKPCSSTNTLNLANTSWRTILIGGMRLGGSCKNSSYVGADGVITPLAGEGYSSYFALDVTDQSAPPKLLWEYAPTDGSLGFTTTGPAIVRISARNPNTGNTASVADNTKNGRWFVVFASGPTGPIVNTQFNGYSDQNLKLHILDLKTGALATTAPIDTEITNAFGGALNNATVDYDLDYQDDALYFGYVSKCPVGTTALGSPTPSCSSTNWTNGGVLRLFTQSSLAGGDVSTGGTTALNANNWKWSYLIKDIGAVTASVAHLAHYQSSSSTLPDTAYLYFGTGRYFFNSNNGADDQSSQRSLFGIQEPCIDCSSGTCVFTTTCTTSVTSPAPVTLSTQSVVPGSWRIDLQTTSGSTYNERMITDPLAATNGAVFFTTFAPTTDVCSFGGNSYIWAVKYNTGASTAGTLTGKALLQVSTGDIAQVQLGSNRDSHGNVTDNGASSAFGATGDATHEYGRRTIAFTGVSPLGQGLLIVVPPKPINTIMQIRKK